MRNPPTESALHALMTQFPRAGRVEWIGLRPARDMPVRAVQSALAMAGAGLEGDRYAGGSGKRGVTLIQAEHLPAIAALSGHAEVLPPVPGYLEVELDKLQARLVRRPKRAEVPVTCDVQLVVEYYAAR